MPRKDRRFTGEDLVRLYCRNLAPDQRAVVDAIGLYCPNKEQGREERMIALLTALTTPPLADAIALLPGGNYIGKALEIILAVGSGDLSIEGMELVPGAFTFIGQDLESR